MPDYSKNFAISMGGFNNMLNEPQVATPRTGDPKPSNREDYYKASATLAYYKDILNDKLKKKNPKAFADYFKGLSGLRRAGDEAGALKYVQDTPYEEYLSPEEVKTTLGDADYKRYLDSLKRVNDFNVLQGMQPLYGNVEGENDISNLNYGRRFASLKVNPTYSQFNQTRGTNYNRTYTYNPATTTVEFAEGGDLSLRPDFLTMK